MTTISTTSTWPAPASSTATASGPAVATSGGGAFVQDAVALAADSAVVSILGGGVGAATTYNASGLFDTIMQAGTPDAALTPAVAPNSVDQDIVDSLTQPSSAIASLDALAATVPTGSIDQTASYAAILKATPSAAATVVADSYQLGIVSSISTYA